MDVRAEIGHSEFYALEAPYGQYQVSEKVGLDPVGKLVLFMQLEEIEVAPAPELNASWMRVVSCDFSSTDYEAMRIQIMQHPANPSMYIMGALHVVNGEIANKQIVTGEAVAGQIFSAIIEWEFDTFRFRTPLFEASEFELALGVNRYSCSTSGVKSYIEVIAVSGVKL